MSDILVSIIESIANAAAAAQSRRNAAQRAVGSPVAQAMVAPAVRAAPGRSAAAVSPAPAAPATQPAPVPPPAPASDGPRLDPRSLLAGPQSVIRAIVAGEIIGPPIALRRQNLWDGPRV